MKFKILFIWILFAVVFTSCLEFVDKYSKLAPGYWRAELSLIPKNISPNRSGKPLPEKLGLKFDEVLEGQLPFIFEVIYTNDSTFYIEIINGKERIKVTDIKYGRDRKTAKDTVLINFPEYESYIKAISEGGVMEGEFVVTSKENYRIPFSAKQGINTRFTDLKKKPFMDVSGAWQATFDLNTDEPYNAIGLFQQNANELTGTFKTETGDFRFLEGTIQDKKMYLSCFDGSHAFLFEAKIQPDKTIQGSFRSGLSEPSIWEAKLNPNFRLQNPDSITKMNKGKSNINFNFTNPSGKIISLENPEYKGKVKIVQLMGTWCPNCKDESIFLKEYLGKSDQNKLAVIGLAFERHKEIEKANAAIEKYKSALNIPYEIVAAGTNDKKEISNKLDFINEFKAYPTMLIIDKKNKIRKIHTGFSGPATDEFNSFKEEFGTFIELLLKE
ncbi:MAG: TlpA family protein disulfide reductase [Saprospiraceae bacterium]|nr:TlpA family protein disulfide reductase [Saprospiraceae bacterium]